MTEPSEAEILYDAVVVDSGVFDAMREQFPPKKLAGLDIYDCDDAFDAAEWGIEHLLETGVITEKQYDDHRDDLVEMLAAGLA